MLAHCREGYPDEACGILAGRGDEVQKIYKADNIEHSPVRYEMDSRELIRANKDMRENNLSILSIYHSHPSAPAYPSQTDISRAKPWNGLPPVYGEAAYIIVSLFEKEPVVKAFSIGEGIGEVEVIIREKSPGFS